MSAREINQVDWDNPVWAANSVIDGADTLVGNQSEFEAEHSDSRFFGGMLSSAYGDFTKLVTEYDQARHTSITAPNVRPITKTSGRSTAEGVYDNHGLRFALYAFTGRCAVNELLLAHQIVVYGDPEHPVTPTLQATRLSINTESMGRYTAIDKAAPDPAAMEQLFRTIQRLIQPAPPLELPAEESVEQRPFRER